MPSEIIPFDTFVLAAVADELSRTLTGARVQKVRQTDASEFSLSLYGDAGANTLLVSADPRNFRVHLTQVRREPLPTATQFLQAARKWLDGAAFVSADLPAWDRLLRLTFRAPEGETVRVYAELMGRNANVILTTGAENGDTIRAVLRRTTGGERTLRPNAPYTPPPGTPRSGTRTANDPRSGTRTADDKPDLRTASGTTVPDAPDDAAKFLAATFSGVSRFAAAEAVARAAHDGTGVVAGLLSLYADADAAQFDPHQIGSVDGKTVGVWAFVPRSVPAGLRFRRDSVSVALDTFYAALGQRTTGADERAALAKSLTKETAFRERELAAQRRTLAEGERADTFEQWGNLLLASPLLVPDGDADSVTLPDWYAQTEGATVAIPLDAKRTGRENADAYFARARKSRDAAEYADGRAADLADELEQLAALRVRLDAAQPGDDLEAVREGLEEIVGAARVGGSNTPRQTGRKPFDGHKIRTYDLSGFTFYVGETADANDHLLTRVASPSDIWMHVRAATGAHGVLRTNKEPGRVPDAVIRKAAAIVAAKSQSVKHSSLVAVDITERRYVRKPRGAKAGLAQYSQAKTIDVTPQLP